MRAHILLRIYCSFLLHRHHHHHGNVIVVINSFLLFTTRGDGKKRNRIKFFIILTFIHYHCLCHWKLAFRFFFSVISYIYEMNKWGKGGKPPILEIILFVCIIFLQISVSIPAEQFSITCQPLNVGHFCLCYLTKINFSVINSNQFRASRICPKLSECD